MVENGGKSAVSLLPKGSILKKVGYSEAVIKSPQKVTKSKGWNMLMEKYLSEDILAKKHHQLLNAANIIDSYIFPNSLTDAEIKETVEKTPGCVFIRTKRNSQNAHAYFYRPDNGIQFKSLELGYKLQKKLGTTEDGGGGTPEFEAVLLRIRKILPQ